MTIHGNEPMRGMFQGFDIVSNALRAEMQRAHVVATNLGNMHDTGNAENEPYRRRSVVFAEVLEDVPILEGVDGADELATGVEVQEVYEDRKTPLRRFYDPSHEDAGPDGWVLGSNVDLFKEMVDMSVIERSFQANLAAMRTYRTMMQNTITQIGRR